MAKRKQKEMVTLFFALEHSQHDILRQIALVEKKSIADVVRGAVKKYIASYKKEKK